MYGPNLIIPNTVGGINEASLNDFTKIQMGNPQWDGTDRTLLYLFAPYTSPVQVTRPFVYQFTPELVDAIKNGPNLAYGVGPNGTKNPAAYTAILPDSEGMVLNTSTIDNSWSFVLIINTAPRPIGAIVAPGISKVACGYVIGEPVTQDMMNPDVWHHNPNAVFVFTHTNCRNVVRRVGPGNPIDGITDNPNQDVDYVNETTGMMYNDNILLGTPKEIMKYAMSDEAKIGMMDYSPLQLSHVKAGSNDVRAISNDIKAPRQQLSTIMTAIDNGIDHSQEAIPTLHKFLDHDEMYGANGARMSPIEMAQTTAFNNMPSSTFLSFSTGIDTSKPMTFSELDVLFPNLDVIPNKINRSIGYGWDVSPQAAAGNNGVLSPIVSIRNQMSYLASSVIQAICGQLGVSDVSFAYTSHRADSLTRQPCWQVVKFDTTIPRYGDIYKKQVFDFQQYMQNELFDVIYTLCGDFDMYVMANMAGDIVINLHLHNYPDLNDGSYYQTSTRLGGLTNPMIGTLPIINNNVMQLSNVTQQLVSNAFGDMADMGGMTDMPLPEETIPVSM